MKLNKDVQVSGKTYQNGMTVVGMVLVLAGIGFVALMGMRIVPIYIDYFTVKSTLEALKQDPEVKQMSKLEIQQSIQRRFDVGYVTVVTGKDVKLRHDEKNVIVELVYDDRRPLIGNLDTVAKFHETVYLPR